VEVTICHRSKDFVSRLPNADVAVVWYFKEEWLPQATRLKLIATPAAGKDWIDLKPREGLKIWFGGFHGPMIAESVVGGLLYFCKAFPLSRKMQSQRKWAPLKISQKVQSLYRARVTILGFGKIGQAIGRAIKSMGCTITGVKRQSMEPPDYFSNTDKVVGLGELTDVLGSTDHLIIALPGGSEIEGIFIREHFQALPASAFLYNVGRGNVYREEDLVASLAAGGIAGAYLDVFEQEPLAEDSPLWEMDNVLIQPHISAASPQYLELFAEELSTRLLAEADWFS
jgi:phosphoglycerate dehydrogenase-like enzyme